ncbi:LysM peptidoglycan-binding domain-containing protein [Paenibacillus wulumuqiensis]|uniref:LysM peptidoglycan-binding domain-containing protein n=1 Tax=Paenibacillus wulumuqiensis TaxID=1567107 RepID=UPI00061954FA|nr:LysM peptidoglycan-binding domain-containing protein [Paenibacillus wulumuqiensis]
MPSSQQLWFKFNNGKEVLWLPVNPEAISVTTTHGFQDVEVSNLGEYTVMGTNRLRSYSFSSFFPSYYDGSYCEHDRFDKPTEIASQIERWMRSGKPIRFIVTGTAINLPVTIRNFEYEERGGDPGTLWYTIELKEYIFVETPKKKDPTKKAAAPKATTKAKRPDSTVKAKTYTVKAGDSLFKIAQRAEVLGDGDKWRDLYTKNKSVIGSNPNKLKPGQKLVIP